MQAFLARSFGAIPLDRNDSLFGFVERSSLYGWRVFTRPELTHRLGNAVIATKYKLALDKT